MSTELLRSIRIDDEKVYAQLESSNTFPHDWFESEIPSFTEIYQRGGQKKLDKRIIDLLLECAKIVYSDPSMTPYRYALGSKAALKVFEAHGCTLGPTEKAFSCYSRVPQQLYQKDSQEYDDLLDELAELCRTSRARQDKRRGKKMLREATKLVSTI